MWCPLKIIIEPAVDHRGRGVGFSTLLLELEGKTYLYTLTDGETFTLEVTHVVKELDKPDKT